MSKIRFATALAAAAMVMPPAPTPGFTVLDSFDVRLG